MKFCPTCKTEYDLDSQTFCTRDGILLSLPDPYDLVGNENKGTIEGKYRLDQLVSCGGMAVIYCAYQVSMDRKVALKMPLKEYVSNDVITHLFELEAKTTGQLYHDNIVVIHDFGRTKIGATSKIPYIVMEWIEGITLEQTISKGVQDDPAIPPETVPLSLTDTACILRQVAAALDAAHKKKIIHRDVKPSNIMITKDSSGHSHIKVLDFGVSKTITGIDTYTHVTKMVGTLRYASPEQFRAGEEIDRTSDIYSLGIVLYQMLTGRLPFFADSNLELQRKHKEDPPPKVSDLRPEAIVVEEVLLKMMDKSRRKRPDNALDIADLFDNAIIPVMLDGQVVWTPGNTDFAEAISGATIKLNQDGIAPQESNEDGFFSFNEVINMPHSKIRIEATYFETKDYDIKAGQVNLIHLTPEAIELSGQVEAQVNGGGSNIPFTKLRNVELRMVPLGPPARGELITKTDNEGLFKIPLVGPHQAYIDTTYTVHIDGFHNRVELLREHGMRFIMMPLVAGTVTPDTDVLFRCPHCDRPYANDLLQRFCHGCGEKLHS